MQHLIAVLAFALAASAPAAARRQQQDVRKVHALFMNHLDVGFSGGSNHPELVGFAAQVVDLYFNTYFPAALDVADALRDAPRGQRFVYTTKAWLVALYLDCPPGLGVRCPDAAARARFEAAVARGDVRWHAYPFNTEPETMDAALADFAVRLTHDLDDRFGLPHKTVFSQRDVPGTTRAAVPLLARRGVRAMSFGVNGASAPPDVASVGVWRHIDAATGSPTDMLLLVHPGGYGGILRSDCHIIDGFDEALCLYFKNDNDGPPSAAEVQSVYATLQQQFPEAADIVASSFEAFVDAVYAAGAQALVPVYTEEIGDTWLHGMAADPLQAAQFRAIMRERTRCINDGACLLSDQRFYNFSRLLLKAAEHTHGGDVKRFLEAEGGDPEPQYFYWSNEEFSRNRDDPLFVQLEDSWREQRDWSIRFPLDALEDHPLAATLQDVLSTVGRPKVPDLSEYIAVQPGEVLRFGEWALAVDNRTGAVNYLVNERTGAQLADATHPLGRVFYQTFDEAAFNDFMAEYFYTFPIPEWALFDYGKLNLSTAAPQRATWQPQVQRVRRLEHASTLQIAVELVFAAELHTRYGAPASALLQIAVPQSAGAGATWRWTLTWLDKTPTRIPETLWLAFQPVGSERAPWRVSKLGEWIDLASVRTNGSWHLHAVDEGGVRAPAGVPLDFVPVDSLLASFGDLTPFPTPLREPDWSRGVAFPLCGNIWGTNYPMWYPFEREDADASLRFDVRVTGTSR